MYLNAFQGIRIHLTKIRIHSLWLPFFFTRDSNLFAGDSNPSCLSKLTRIQIRIRSMRIWIHFFKQTFFLPFLDSRFKSIPLRLGSWSSNKLTGIGIRIHSIRIRISFRFPICTLWNWDSNLSLRDSNPLQHFNLFYFCWSMLG